MKKSMVAVPAVLALALTVSACGKTDTADNAAVSNELLLNDDGAFEANGTDALSNEGGATDTVASDNASLDNGAAALGNGQ